MSSMQMHKVIPTNKIVDDIYEKHIRNPLDEWVSGKISKTAKLNAEEVSTIICLHIFGASNKDIVNIIEGVSNSSVCEIIFRKAYCNVKIPFVKNIRKVRGKMVTYYDEDKVIEYFNNLSPELKSVTLYQVISDRLFCAVKLRK